MAIKAIKYLYIDDEFAFAQSCAQEVERCDPRIIIDCKTPDSFDQEIVNFETSLDDYYGLILDWKLDLIPSDQKKRVAFRAGSLAQEIRTRGSERTEGKEAGFKELPVVIWSVQSKLERSFYGDATSGDLFDAVYEKGYVSDHATSVASQLIALAEGYHLITDQLMGGFHAILHISEDDVQYLDPTFVNCLSNGNKVASLASVHDYARFLLREVIEIPGQLVREELLAARLGIKMDNEAWIELLELIPEDARYLGPFCQAWPRWWWPVVEGKWWGQLFAPKRAPKLSTLTASERVDVLKECTGIQSLAAAEPFDSSYSRRFYTMCELTGCPLDPVDGVLLGGKEPQSWQDSRYISINAALEGLYRDENWNLHPVEEERIRALRKSRSRHGQ
jgi:hypothetical protein